MGDQELVLKASPSLLYQNLSFGENKFVYVHKSEAHSVNVQTKETSSFQVKDKTPVQQAKVVHLAWGTVVVVATPGGVQFWDVNREKAMFNVHVDDEGKTHFLCRGIAAQDNNVLLGLSTGTVAVIATTKDSGQLLRTLKHHHESITDICSGQVNNQPMVASADLSGEVLLFNAALELKAKVDKFTGDVCTSLALTPRHVVGGYGSGKIRAFSPEGRKAVEIAAHCRWINSIAYNPKCNLLVSASEDMLVQFWQMPSATNGQVTHAGHRLVKDSLLTGVCFTDDGRRVGCTAYDMEKLHVFEVPQ